MAVLGYRPTRTLIDLLTVIRREMGHTGTPEYFVTWTLMTEPGYFQEINMDSVVLGNHIDAVMAGLSPALKEEEYRTPEACLVGEAEKLGMTYRFDYMNTRFAFRLRRPTSEHRDCRGERASGNR